MEQITFRLKPGQYLKEEIVKVVAEKSVSAGVFLSIVGSLENAVLRMAGSKPENEILKKWEGPFEIVSGTGTVSKDGCHIHVSVSNQKGSVIGGHLIEGCKVQTTAEVVLGVFDDIVYKRTLDTETGFSELETE